jgi:penicillin-binding protein 2
MWAVVNEGGGTGASARCPGIDIAGKTGTAQVVSMELQKASKNKEFNFNAWFVGYAPAAKPEIVVAALVMQGGHSTVAVPIARDVIKAYFDKKLGPKPPDNQMETSVRVLSQLRPAILTKQLQSASKQ